MLMLLFLLSTAAAHAGGKCATSGMLPTAASEDSPILPICDYGSQFQTFEIAEENMLELLRRRLAKAEQDGKIAMLQKQFEEKVRAGIRRPQKVAGIQATTEERTFFWDPTQRQNTDVRDHNGKVVVAAGTEVNPLDSLDWGEDWLFIDGDNEESVNRALQENARIILVAGSPMQLNEDRAPRFFFDQAGVYCRKFDIRQVPARVTQAGNRLQITEFTWRKKNAE